MRKRTLAIVACALAIINTSSASGVPRPLTKIELRTAPPAQTNARLRELVWNMFDPQDYRRKKTPRAALTDVYLKTKRTGTHIPGLCRYDSVRVDFSPENAHKLGARAPSRPVGLRSSSYFAFRTPPKGWSEDLFGPTSDASAACAGIPEEFFFRSEDEQVATDAAYAWRLLQDALKANDSVSLKCSLYPVDKLTCSDLIKSLASSRINDAAQCETDAPDFCYRVGVEARAVDIIVDRSSPDGQPSAKVKAAQLKSYIVIADERVD